MTEKIRVFVLVSLTLFGARELQAQCPTDFPVSPLSTTVCAGSTVNVTLSNSESGVDYQLLNDADNSPLSATLSGTGGSMVITSSALTSTTVIKVFAHNTSTLCDVDFSNKVTVTVQQPPSVADAGSPQTLCGTSTSLAATNPSTGTGNWTFAPGGNTDGLGNINNPASPSSTFSGSANTTYSLIWTVSNGPCPSSSDNITITFQSAPAITLPPAASVICENSSTQFTVTTTGIITNYQWRANGSPISDNAVYAGSGTATLSLANVPGLPATYSGTNYDVVLTGPCGTQTSSQALLTVNEHPEILGHPSSQVVCQGANVDFAVDAGVTTGVNYVWEVSTNSGVSYTTVSDGGIYSGASTGILHLTGVTTAYTNYLYRAIISGVCPSPLTSTPAALTVNPNATIVTSPVNAEICEGATVQFSVAISGTASAYQWRQNGSVLSNGAGVSGATTPTLTLTNVALASNGFDYTVDVTGCSGTQTSGQGILTVRHKPEITAQPLSVTVCEGGSTSMTVNPGLTYNPTFQWELSTDGGNTYSNQPALTTATVNFSGVTAAQNGHIYRAIVNGFCNAPVTSNVAILNVNVKPAISANPVSQSVCAGGPVSFSVTASGTGITYQWYHDGAPVGGNSSTYSIPATTSTDAGNYIVTVSGTCTPAATSSPVAILTINSAPVITVQPVSSQSVCEGSAGTFTVTATGTGLSYQWKKNGVDIGSATASSYTIPATASADGGTYTVVVSGTCTPPVTSTGSVLTIQEQPEIIAGPINQTVCAGQSATFTVNAGVTTGVSYQWFKGATPVGTNSNTFTIPATTATDAGSYTVTVSGTCSPAVTSPAATLTINAAPVITVQPVASQSVCEGSATTFTVTATGTGLSYQWKKNGVDIGSATASSYTIPATSSADGGTYTVAVNGNCTPPVTSSGSVLTIQEQPEIITGPVNQTVCAGQSATFTVNAGVTTGVSYQWFKGATPVGTNSNTFTIPATTATDAGSYTVTVSGTCSPAVTSPAATLTINAAPVITVQPVASQSVCEGSAATFTVTATGTALNYQWKKNGVDIVSATASSYTIPVAASADGGTYTVSVTGTCTPAITSNGSVMTIQEKPEIITGPVNQTVCEGQSATFTVNAGVTTGVSYQWYKGATPVGTNSNTFTIPTTVAADAGSYSVTVSGTCSPAVSSSAATLTIDAQPVITVQPASGNSVCEGSAATFTVTATGTGLNYQWKKNGVDIAGATASTYTIPATVSADAGTYVVSVGGTCTPATTSTASVLTIREQPEITAGPASQTVCEGQSATFTVNAGVTTSPSYQWYKGVTPVGSNSNTFTIPATTASDAGNYRVIISGTCSPSVSSSIVTLTINTSPVITVQPVSNQSVCEGSAATFTVTATGTGLTYQWKKNGVDIGSATASSYTIPATVSADAATYTVSIAGSCTPAITSNGSVLVIQETPEIITGPASQTVCEGQGATFTVNAGVTTGASYQWFKGATPVGTNSNTFTIPVTVAADAGSYSVTVSGTCSPAVSSSAATLTINTSPVITAQPVASQSVCEGSSATFSVTATGTSLNYQWKKNGVDIGGATSASYTIPATVSADAGMYTVSITGTCTPARTSTASVLTIQEKPEIITGPVSQAVCAGQSVTFTVNAGVTTGVSYQWFKGATPVGSNSSTFTIANTVAGDAGNYTVTVSGTCSPAVTSSVATLTINGVPNASASNASICSGAATNITITNPNGVPGTTFTWTVQSAVNASGASAGSGATIAQTLTSIDGSN